MTTRALAILLVPFTLACGGPTAGASCDKSGAVCESASRALECQNKKWVAIACRGPAGCTVADKTVSCDYTGALEGDGCGLAQDGKFVCQGDGKATLICRDGSFKQSQLCRSCTVMNEQVVCQP